MCPIQYPFIHPPPDERRENSVSPAYLLQCDGAASQLVVRVDRMENSQKSGRWYIVVLHWKFNLPKEFRKMGNSIWKLDGQKIKAPNIFNPCCTESVLK